MFCQKKLSKFIKYERTVCHKMCWDASSNGSFCPWDALSTGHNALGTLRYEDLGDGPSQGRFVRGRIVRVPISPSVQ
jgi:hypothetical protein